jgi:type IV secretory pathway VirB4 component
MRRIESKLIKQIFSLLIFGKIWQIISRPNIFGITKTTPRLVLIDEAWLYMEIPSAATFLEKVARLGRKRNCILIINTQRPADMLGTNLEIKAGRTILENSSTKILMRQDDSNKILIKEVFGLSDQEADIVVEFPQGEGLLITDTIHIRVQFLATSDEEYQLLTTKPSEII